MNKLYCRSMACGIASWLCLLMAGCAGDHLFRAQDRKIEELRLDRSRQDDLLGRTREAVDALRQEWLSFTAREGVAAREMASLPGAIRKLAQRVDDLEGKHARLEERVEATEKKSTDLQQSLAQVTSSLRTAEADLMALRSTRLAQGLPQDSLASGRDAGTRTPGEGASAGEIRGTGKVGSWTGGSTADVGFQGLFFSVLWLAMGALVAVTCIFLGAWIRSGGTARPLQRERGVERAANTPNVVQAPTTAREAQPPAPPPKEAQPTPQHPPCVVEPPAAEATRVDAAPVVVTSAVDDFFDKAEKASVRFAGSGCSETDSKVKPLPRRILNRRDEIFQGTKEESSKTDFVAADEAVTLEASDTVVMSLEQVKEERLGNQGDPPTEPISEAPDNTQLIVEGERLPAAQDPAPPTPVHPTEKPRLRSMPATALQRKTQVSEEKNLLDELENLISQRVGERPV